METKGLLFQKFQRSVKYKRNDLHTLLGVWGERSLPLLLEQGGYNGRAADRAYTNICVPAGVGGTSILPAVTAKGEKFWFYSRKPAWHAALINRGRSGFRLCRTARGLTELLEKPASWPGKLPERGLHGCCPLLPFKSRNTWAGAGSCSACPGKSVFMGQNQ